MSTVATIINKTQRQLLSGLVEERNKLATNATSTATSITLSYDLEGIRKGTIIEIDSELMYVWEVTTASKTVTVERAFNGSTAAAHTAGDIVTISPRFPRAQILEAINDELSDLSSPAHGLFAIRNVDVSYNGNDSIINLPVSKQIIDILDVRLRYTGDDYPSIRKTQLIRNLPTQDFPSTYGLKFNQGTRAGDLRITYKAPFYSVATEADNIQTVAGLPISAEDILVIGAQIRLIAPREIRRNFTESQGDTRRPEEVPTGAINQSISNLLRLRRDRIMAEAAKLARQYPILLSKD